MSVDPRKLQASLKAIAQQADAALAGTVAILQILARSDRITADETREIADVIASNLDLPRQYDLEKTVRTFLPRYSTPQRRSLAEQGLGGIRLQDEAEQG